MLRLYPGPTFRPVTLLCALVFVAVMGLGATNAARAHEGAEGNIVVHVTEAGFEPESVEVRKGTTVVFENTGDEDHWPASDDHPTHDLYAGFDPEKPLRPDTEWTFTFDRPGDWGYHDHLNPYLTGEIIVKNEEAGEVARDSETEHGGLFSSIKTFLGVAVAAVVSAFAPGEDGAHAGESDSNDGGSSELSESEYEEAKDRYVALVRSEDPRVALDRLREETKTNDALLRSCHAMVHDIGREAYEKYGDFGEAMKYQDEVCNSGYLHGVIESRLYESDDVFADMKTLCAGYAPGSYPGWQCYHGIGHGVMFYTGNDLPRSLDMCDGFESAFGRSNCVNGVFMENFNTDQKLHLSEFLKESDPFYPCAEQAERHKANCYLYAPTYYLSLEGNGYADALDWCTGAETGHKLACAYGVGAQATKENLNDPELIESTCADGEPEQTAPCIAGMVDLYVNHYGSLQPARELCARLETSNRGTCYRTVEARSGLFET
jgi:plastocyanin